MLDQVVRSSSTTLGLVGIVALTLAPQLAAGCGTSGAGAPFSSVGGQADAGEAAVPTEGGGASEGGASATAGTNAIAGVPSSAEAGTPGVFNGCRGPEDCGDDDPCTQDDCRADGICVLSPKCAAAEKCCEGDCGECCEHQDCDDNIGCTDDVCFAGGCQHVPDDGKCEQGEYCSLLGDCMAKEPCNPLDPAACNDGSTCTADDCSFGLCLHAFCSEPDATQCCPETGCAKECCADQECDGDDDPCTVGRCGEGQCSLVPLCAEGEKCCATSDGASCGSCCSAEDCNDGIACTVDSCVEGRCYNPPNDKLCPALQKCFPAKRGCALL